MSASTRRTVLRAAGVAVALPPLLSLAPRSAKAQSATKRFLCFYTANGLPYLNTPGRRAEWFPTGTRTDWAPSRILAPVASVKAHVSVIKGVANTPAYREPGGHPSGTAGFLTCAQLKTAPNRVGVSIDQVIAKHVGGAAKFPSLVAGIMTPHPCSQLPCVFRENISWVTPERPAPRVTDPKVAFELLFGGVGGSPQESAARLARRTSVLDLVRRQATRLGPQLSGPDRAKLDEYLTSVREIEARLQLTPPPATSATCQAPARPVNTDAFATWRDLMVLAFRCDATRVIAFMLSDSQSTAGDHHRMSHAPGQNYEALVKVAQEQVAAFVSLVQALRDSKDADGKSVLDNTLAFFSNEVADGNRHDQVNRPVLVAGSLGGRFPSGQLLDFGREIRQSDLFITFAEMFGVTLTTFGDDGQGAVRELRG